MTFESSKRLCFMLKDIEIYPEGSTIAETKTTTPELWKKSTRKTCWGFLTELSSRMTT